MKRMIAAASIAGLALSLPATTTVAHPCACLPPGEWNEHALSPEIATTTPQAATVIGDGVLLFATTPESTELDAFVLEIAGSGVRSASTAPGVIPVDLGLPEGANPGFVVSDRASNDVLMGGSISPAESPDPPAPFLQVSADGGRTWTEIDLEGSGMDIVIDGAKHQDGFAISGATDVGGVFYPAVATWNGEILSPAQQLGNTEGFGITIASGPGSDILSVGGVTVNKKGKQLPALFTVHDDKAPKTNLPGAKDAFPVDAHTSGDDLIIGMNDGRVLHSGAPGEKLAQMKGLKGSTILPLTGDPNTALMAFDMTGPRFSVDGGDTWARSGVDGLADAGTIKATGITDNGDFFALSRGEDDHPHLFFAPGPGPIVPVDGLQELANMMAGFLVEDLVSGMDGVPTPQFVDEVTGAMHDIFAARADGTPVEESEEGSPEQFAEKFLDRLDAAGGSGMTSEFLWKATWAIEAEYDERTGAGE